ncbi:hypothetical protein DAPPUDRAFT_266702 [Daphnia pulex]|uniref:Uncharacterized protein n=1 Tax=Daphnia pulex TaxID=6669 RepID=E9HVH5_DAPPU|nr:hypothetical protein DAPPUDRAFT_266702 [Daphnia pulex]|eukprot:EFX64257.1 hypothetical protein DAPPUDRAFT_266702 [Daphnia pulex]
MEDRTSVVIVTPPWRKTFDFQMMQEDITFGQECFRKAILHGRWFVFELYRVTSGELFTTVALSSAHFLGRHFFFRMPLSPSMPTRTGHLVYSILLLILSMAALDRYLAIVRYEWYKKSVTNCGVITLIFFACVVVLSFVVITIPSTTLIQQSVTVKFVNSRSGNSNFGFGGVEPNPVPEKISAAFAEYSAVSLNENDACLHPDNYRLPPAINHLGTEFLPWMKNRSKIKQT